LNDDIKAWIKKANEDFHAAHHLHELHFFDTSCYHCQQSAEKYLKAIFAHYDEVIPRTHDLERLCFILIDKGLNIHESLLDDCRNLTSFATIVRYPGYDASHSDSYNTLKYANSVKQFVLDYFAQIET
jgi:HEPN domain-containing protein